MELPAFWWGTPKGNGSSKVQEEENFLKGTGQETRGETDVHVQSC